MKATQYRRFVSCITGIAASALVCSWSLAQPRTVWYNEQDSAENLQDIGFNVNVDSAGNTVVVAVSYGNGTGQDVEIIKYDATGKLEWTARYDGPDHLDELLTEVVFDSNDNIILAGVTYTADEGTNYLTLKYDPDGTLLWAKEYNGPGNGNDWSSGFGALDLDDSDNIYLTGYAWGANSHYEYATVKYDANGNVVWTRLYAGPAANTNSYGWAIRYAPSGHLYVAGDARNLAGNGDYTLLKYDLDGNLIWDSQFDSLNHLNDSVYQMDIDSDENVYITGIARTPEGGFDYSVAKFDSAGVLQWEGNYDGGVNGYHYGWVIAADDLGNAYVSGAWMTSGGEYDIVTVKFADGGAVEWANRYPTPWFGDDWAYDIEMTPDGNIVLTGYIWNWHVSGHDAITMKLDPAGNVLWDQIIDGAASGTDFGYGVVVDAIGDIVVTGTVLGFDALSDVFTVKYSDNPPPSLDVSPDPLLAGQTGTFTASGFAPDHPCYLIYSLSGLREVFVPFLNTSIDLKNPQQAGNQRQSDGAGSVEWNLPIPPNAGGTDIWFQVAQYNQASEVVATSIQ